MISYVCGIQFTTTEIASHQKACFAKWEDEISQGIVKTIASSDVLSPSKMKEEKKETKNGQKPGENSPSVPKSTSVLSPSSAAKSARKIPPASSENSHTHSPIIKKSPMAPSSSLEVKEAPESARRDSLTASSVQSDGSVLEGIASKPIAEETPIVVERSRKESQKETSAASTLPAHAGKDVIGNGDVPLEKIESLETETYASFNSSLVHCPKCQRKFVPSRLEIHERSCKGQPALIRRTSASHLPSGAKDNGSGNGKEGSKNANANAEVKDTKASGALGNALNLRLNLQGLDRSISPAGRRSTTVTSSSAASSSSHHAHTHTHTHTKPPAHAETAPPLAEERRKSLHVGGGVSAMRGRRAASRERPSRRVAEDDASLHASMPTMMSAAGVGAASSVSSSSDRKMLHRATSGSLTDRSSHRRSLEITPPNPPTEWSSPPQATTTALGTPSGGQSRIPRLKTPSSAAAGKAGSMRLPTFPPLSRGEASSEIPPSSTDDSTLVAALFEEVSTLSLSMGQLCEEKEAMKAEMAVLKEEHAEMKGMLQEMAALLVAEGRGGRLGKLGGNGAEGVDGAANRMRHSLS
jgi:hypothetical protein